MLSLLKHFAFINSRPWIAPVTLLLFSPTLTYTRFKMFSFFALAVFLPLIQAIPAPIFDLATTPLDDRSASCKFTDVSSLASGKSSCSTITLSNIAVPAGTTLDLTMLKTGTKVRQSTLRPFVSQCMLLILPSSQVVFEGTTTFGYKEWEGPLISVSGTNIAVSGASGHLIDCGGARWWDGQGSNGGKTKPKTFYAHSLKQSSISGLNVKNTPVQFMSINTCTDLHVDNVSMDNSAGASKGHNTDAFDVGSSTNVYISGAKVKNQDDCLAINSGTNIKFTGGSCDGGHGLSIGSVGGRSDNVVKGVSITDSKITNSQNGVRIKTVYGATGSVSGVTYSNIQMSGITKYGIVIQQDYKNGSPTGTATTGVPITDLSISSVTGSVASSGTNVYILCGSGSCSNWKWSGVSVTGGKKSTKCSNVPKGGAAC